MITAKVTMNIGRYVGPRMTLPSPSGAYGFNHAPTKNVVGNPRQAQATPSLAAVSVARMEREKSASMSLMQVGKLARTRLSALLEPRSGAQRLKDDAKVPASDDPVRHEQAKKATAFLRGRAANPFASQSREVLSAILYDDSGAYTLNERHAALKEINHREFQWRLQILAERDAERMRTGRSDAVDAAIEAYYAQLPLLDRASYLTAAGQAMPVASRVAARL